YTRPIRRSPLPFFSPLHAPILFLFFFFSLLPPPPRSTLFPYTTLFRSIVDLPLNGRNAISLAGLTSGVIPGPAFSDGPLNLANRSAEHTSELQSLRHLVCRLLLEKKKKKNK